MKLNYNQDIIQQLIKEQKDLKFQTSGFYRGVVLDNQDPIKIGRLKIFVPVINKELSSSETASDHRVRPLEEYAWVPYVTPFGGTHNSGVFFVPDVGAIVVVGFFDANPDAMFWMGSVADPEIHNPPIASIGSSFTQYPRNRIIRTPKGAMIEIDDSDGYERIEITSSNGNTIGIEDYRDNTIRVRAKGDIHLDSGGAIFINASGGIHFSSNTDVNVSAGNNVNLRAPNSVNVEKDLNVHGEILSQTGCLTLVDGDIDVNGDVLATGNMLAEGVSSNHHQHIVLAEAIDRDPDGKEIVDTRMVRASHVHPYMDMHVVPDHQHRQPNAGSNELTHGATQTAENIVRANTNFGSAERNNEFVCSHRVTQRDGHIYDDDRKPKPQTTADARTGADNMLDGAASGGELGTTGLIQGNGDTDQQHVKVGNPESMIDNAPGTRSCDVLVEQVDRDYYKKHKLHDTPYTAMRHSHSVRGVAI